MNLADLLKAPARKVFTKRLKDEVAKAKYVNPDATKPLGIIVCFEKELFPPDSKPTDIHKTIITQRDATAWITGFLSKNPHYKYLQSTLSKWSNGRKYWFLDTTRNVTVIKTFADISSQIKIGG